MTEKKTCLRAIPRVVAEIVGGKRFRVVGRDAETLLLLVRRGERGVTAFDFPGGPAFRLGAYVHDLRREGLGIRTEREPHDGGTHARYVLETPVTVIGVDVGVSSAAA
ncbi:winged helix domain-containing protein [Salinarimonas ramus]|uniref:Winged helix domain-containing protein n=1 Tax=Salinarimonas ramus TaxID=690164 RepID=A0A917Q5B0_9HYPH|nr:hypothetical protein [Salinarimonas ramus]GGK28226.1 hypothetical protein GCM10011322_13430 [Salinarimonas ramus]